MTLYRLTIRESHGGYDSDSESPALSQIMNGLALLKSITSYTAYKSS